MRAAVGCRHMSGRSLGYSLLFQINSVVRSDASAYSKLPLSTAQLV